MKQFDAPFSDGNTKLYIFWIALLVGSFVGLSALYRSRSQKSPIKERPHYLVLSTVGPFVTISVMYSFVNVLPPDQLYCFPTILVLAATFLALATSITIRIGLLLWEFQITQKKLMFINDSGVAASEVKLAKLKNELSKVKDRSKWFRLGSFMGWAISFLATFLTFRLGDYSFDLKYYGDGLTGHVQCAAATRYNLQYWILPNMSVQILVGGWLFFLMRFAQDNFYIKQELIQTICIMIIPALMIVLSIASVPLGDTEWDYGTSLFLNIPALLQVIVSFGIPVWRSYCYEFRQSRVLATSQSTGATRHSSLDDLKKDFQLVLEDPVGADLFQKFLQREWSVENVLFWRVSSEFRTKFHSKDSAARATESQNIYDEYVSPTAPLCVNLPHEIRTEITHSLAHNELTADVFHKAEQEIFMLMLKDSFRRFTFREDSGYLQIQQTIAARRNSVLTVQSDRRGSGVPLMVEVTIQQ